MPIDDDILMMAHERDPPRVLHCASSGRMEKHPWRH
jgi:hypothetical protein